MPRCGCQDACSCLIVAGDGISVEGIGTLERPYEITSESSDLTGRIIFTDEGNVDFTSTGVGTLNDPTTVFADALLAVKDLTDVPDTDPTNGQVLVWRDGQWEYENQSGGGSGGSGVPPGGLTGEVLTKLSNTDGDADWEPISGGGGAVVEPVYASSRGHAAALSIPTNTVTVIPFDTNVYEDGIPWEVAPSNLFRIPVDGYYQVDATVTYVGGNSTGSRIIYLYRNAAAEAIVTMPPTTGASSTSVAVSETIKCFAGDYVTIRTLQSTAGALALNGDARYTNVSITKVPEAAPGGGGVIVDRPVSGSWLRNSTQTLTSGTISPIALNTEAEPPVGGITQSGGAITIPEDGLYAITANVVFAVTSATGNRFLYVYVNGVSKGKWSTGAAQTPGYPGITGAMTRSLKAGDTVLIQAYQNSGANLDILGDAGGSVGATIARIPAAYSGSAVSTYGEQTYFASRGTSSGQSIPNATQTVVALDVQIVDDGIPYNGTAFVIPVAGYYDVEAMLTFSPGANGSRNAFIRLNGSSQQASSFTPSTSGTTSAAASVTIKCAVGDLVDVSCQQNSGGALALLTNSVYSRMSITKVPAPVVNGAAASGVWGAGSLALAGTDPNYGSLIYIDSRGQLRGQPQALSTSVYPKVAADLPGTYLTGMTIVQMTGAQSAAGGWPEGVSGSVVTFRRSGESNADACASQWYYVTTSVRPRAYYRSGSGTGAANQWSPWVKVTDSAPPRTARRKSTSQTLAASTWTNVTFDIDVESNTSIPYSNGVFTVPEDGVYQVNAMLLFGGLTAGAQQRMRILVDAGSIGEQATNTPYSGDALTMSKSWRMTAGQTFTIGAWANAAGNVTGSGVSYTVMDITKISA